jgi:DNA polymerase (family 10)
MVITRSRRWCPRRARGYAYVAVADHSPSARVAGGLSADELRAQIRKIRGLQRKHPTIAILAATECDIRADGALDYPDEVLAELDLVVAAVHSHFKQPKAEMTRRICAALAHPHVNILAHPTGRLLGERDPYAVDLERVVKAAKRHGKAVEINAHPDRLDLDDVHARRAGELGVLVAINTDSHVLSHLATIELGVATARRAWLGAPSVVNTWPIEKLRGWARPGRGGRSATTS